MRWFFIVYACWQNPPPPAFSPFAKAQTGGMVTMRYSAKEAEIAQKEMVDYFLKNLKWAVGD